MACVWSAFKNRPDPFQNLLIASIEFSNGFFFFFFPLFISCVSSANWDILCSTLFIQIPLISLYSLVMIAKISTQKINMYGDIGSPCRHPRSTVNHWVVCPFTITVHLMFFYLKKKKVSIHLGRFFSKTKCSKSPKHAPPIKRVKRFIKVEA